MAMTTYELQPGHSEGVGADGLKKKTLVYKGYVSALSSLASGYAAGEGWRLEGLSLVKTNGTGIGELTINLSQKEEAEEEAEGGEEAGTAEAPPLKDVWSVHSVRNDKSVFAYCGDSVGANPQRAQIEMWMKETDGDLAAAFQYRDRDGEVISLESIGPATVALAQKIARGVESVVRFYPVVTRRRTYSTPPACMEDVGYIDTPPVAQAGISLSGYTWLKMQDDCDQNPDGTWTRTESWWGELESEGDSGWDPDLYGPDRWDMPASIT